jgi:AbiJ N-terminal domain 4
LLVRLGADFFGLREDEIEEFINLTFDQIKPLAMKLSWFRFYDFIEFIANDPMTAYHGARFCRACNEVLKEELAGYRFVASQLAPITNNEEIATVESVIALSGVTASVSTHIATALARLADRPHHSRNSMKESISAVEAVCQYITGDSKATIKQALKTLGVHPALASGFSAINGYTSDAQGIRLALSDVPTVDVDDAKFFLVSCSAFINYLLAKSSESPDPKG